MHFELGIVAGNERPALSALRYRSSPLGAFDQHLCLAAFELGMVATNENPALHSPPLTQDMQNAHLFRGVIVWGFEG